MNLDEIQPVVVYVNDERRSYMETVCKGLPWETMFFKAYTPSDSTEYINYKHKEYPEKDTTLCCTRSHIGALKHFLEYSDKQLVMILEDDIAITKNNFLQKLDDALKTWEKYNDEIDYLSIGYGPNLSIKSNKNENGVHWDLYCKDGNVWGTLAYIVKRSVAFDIVEHFDKPNTLELQKAVQQKVADNKLVFALKEIRLQSDVIFSICWRQAFLRPMLVIENPIFHSSITPTDSNANTRWWHLLFQSGELKIDDFENAAMFR